MVHLYKGQSQAHEQGYCAEMKQQQKESDSHKILL